VLGYKSLLIVVSNKEMFYDDRGIERSSPK
jgi:hypothetical protein